MTSTPRVREGVQNILCAGALRNGRSTGFRLDPAVGAQGVLLNLVG